MRMFLFALSCTILPYGCQANECREMVDAMRMSASQHLECCLKYGKHDAEIFYWKGQVDAYTLTLLVLDDCESSGSDGACDR
jgi:hypothetical protein